MVLHSILARIWQALCGDDNFILFQIIMVSVVSKYLQIFVRNDLECLFLNLNFSAKLFGMDH